MRILQIFQNIAMYTERQVEADHICIFQRRYPWQAQARPIFQRHIHRLRVCDPVLHERDRFPPQGMLQTVRYKAGNIFFAHYRLFPRLPQLPCAQFGNILPCLFRLDVYKRQEFVCVEQERLFPPFDLDRNDLFCKFSSFPCLFTFLLARGCKGILRLTRDPVAVSYTHLDVYKRQV